jgi:hypothetical protein
MVSVDFHDAIAAVKRDVALPAVPGRICPVLTRRTS